jgi:hypothetical protein
MSVSSVGLCGRLALLPSADQLAEVADFYQKRLIEERTFNLPKMFNRSCLPAILANWLLCASSIFLYLVHHYFCNFF